MSVAWACRAQNREVNDCLHQYTRAEDYDAIKLEYMHERRPDLLQARPLPTKPLSSR